MGALAQLLSSDLKHINQPRCAPTTQGHRMSLLRRDSRQSRNRSRSQLQQQPCRRGEASSPLHIVYVADAVCVFATMRGEEHVMALI